MSNREMAKLGDVFKITSGGTPLKSKKEYYNNGTIPWVKTGDLKQKYITSGFDMITETGLNNSSAKLFPKGTVLIAMYGATIGACSILGVDASTNQACAALLPNEKVNNTYLYYFLISKKQNLIQMGVGGAQPNISATILKSLEILIPPLETQNHISNTLDKVQEIIDGHKKQLKELDNLIRSTFYDMFGNPVKNENNWKVIFINDAYDIIDGDRGVNYPKQGDFSDRGYCVFLNTGNITRDGFNFEKVQYISKQKDNQLRKGKLMRKDIVFTTRGTVGNLAYYESDIPYDNMRINSGMILLRDKMKILNPVFFCNLFKNTDMVRYYKTFLTGTAQPQLPITNMRKIKIIAPPIELQNKFSEIVSNIEEQKSLVKQSIKESENLFNSLMSKYFD